MAQVVQKPSVRSPGAPNRPRWPRASAWGIALTAAKHRPCFNPGGRWVIFGWNLRMARSRALVFVSLKWSHGFLSVIFGFLAKFWLRKYFFEKIYFLKMGNFSSKKLFWKKNVVFWKFWKSQKNSKIWDFQKIQNFKVSKFWDFQKFRKFSKKSEKCSNFFFSITFLILKKLYVFSKKIFSKPKFPQDHENHT